MQVNPYDSVTEFIHDVFVPGVIGGVMVAVLGAIVVVITLAFSAGPYAMESFLHFLLTSWAFPVVTLCTIGVVIGQMYREDLSRISSSAPEH